MLLCFIPLIFILANYSSVQHILFVGKWTSATRLRCRWVKMESYADEESNNAISGKYQQLIDQFDEQCRCEFNSRAWDGRWIKPFLLHAMVEPTNIKGIEELLSRYGENHECHVLEQYQVSKRWLRVSRASWRDVSKLSLSRSMWGLSNKTKSNQVRPNMLRNILLRCGSHIKEVHLSPIYDDTYPEMLSDVAALCPHLQIIDASKFEASADSIRLLGRNCSLRSLSLGEVNDAAELPLIRLLKRSKKLNHFMLGAIDIGKCLLDLPSTTIHEIALTHCNHSVLDYLAQALPHIKHLSTLILSNDDGGRGFSLPTPVMEAVSRHWKQLKRFEVIGMNFNDPNCMLLILKLTNLEFLNLQATDIDDVFLRKLSSNCQKLTHLTISDCESITLAGILALASLPKLSQLVINWSTDFDLEAHRWDEYEDMEIQELPCTRDFANLKHLLCRQCYMLSPSEIYCLIKSSPLLELIDLTNFHERSAQILRRLVRYAIDHNSKVVFKISTSDH